MESFSKARLSLVVTSEITDDRNKNRVALLDEPIPVTYTGHSSAEESGYELDPKSIIL